MNAADITHVRMLDDDWENKYKPITNMRTTTTSEPSYGFDCHNAIDLDYLAGVDNSYIWTHVDCEDSTCIINGVHIVNRIQYFVTELPAPLNTHIVVVNDVV